MRNRPPPMRIRSRPDNSWPKITRSGAVRPMIQDSENSKPMRISIARLKPSKRAFLGWSPGSFPERMEMKTTLSIPRTSSSATRVMNAIQACGSVIHSIWPGLLTGSSSCPCSSFTVEGDSGVGPFHFPTLVQSAMRSAIMMDDESFATALSQTPRRAHAVDFAARDQHGLVLMGVGSAEKSPGMGACNSCRGAVTKFQVIGEMIEVRVIRTCFQEEYAAFFVLRETRGEDVASGSGPDDHDVVTHGISFVR